MTVSLEIKRSAADRWNGRRSEEIMRNNSHQDGEIGFRPGFQTQIR